MNKKEKQLIKRRKRLKSQRKL